jgi:exodeoxyribonuclease VII large subunit
MTVPFGNPGSPGATDHEADGTDGPARRSALQLWGVGALCKAVADALEARFNPVAVRGELTGFSRAASGHCYFSLKDAQGQIRCAMFRRAASLMDFSPRDGDQVEVRGRLGVYEQRGDLQLVVESMSRAGQGALFEQFLRLKAKLEAEGLFDAGRKRPLPLMPRAIGVVTSLGAAALHDVMTGLGRRVPHIPVVVSPALVQGADAPAALVRALTRLYALAGPAGAATPLPIGRSGGTTPTVAAHGEATPPVDVILLVRGGGSIEDLWGFNDEALARTLLQSPVPVISGIGHETDFTIADFVADLRAPTPTAAAELVSAPRDVWLGALGLLHDRLGDSVQRELDRQAQRLDQAQARLGRPSGLMARQQVVLARHASALRYGLRAGLEREHRRIDRAREALPMHARTQVARMGDRLERASLGLGLLDPKLVLERGYAWLTDTEGHAVTRAARTRTGQALTATLADGEVDLTVAPRRLI